MENVTKVALGIVPQVKNVESKVWIGKNPENGETKFFQISAMTDEHLQKALIVNQRRELEAFVLYCKLSSISDNLREEAERRCLTLMELDEFKASEIKYFSNTRSIKKDIKELRASK